MSYLYSDDSIQIDDKKITLLNYYFPSGAPKIIELKEIRNVTLMKLTALNGKYRIWGMGLRPLWFNRQFRADKEQAIIIDTGAFIKSAITPKEVEEVIKVLSSLGISSK